MKVVNNTKELSKVAKENARVTIGTSKSQKVVKEGIPNEHSIKHLANSRIVGVNVGSTVNMENYESLRADVWLTDFVNIGEDYESAIDRVTNIAIGSLQNIVNQFTK